VTVGSTCLFGVDNFKLHMVQVFEISFLLSLMLVAIASINRPYQGDVHVSPEAFRYALETMDEPVPGAEINVPQNAPQPPAAQRAPSPR
jgi:hypothetical protein